MAQELITGGDFSTPSDWTVGGSAIVSGGYVNFPATIDGYVYQVGATEFPTTIGKTYRISIDILDSIVLIILLPHGSAPQISATYLPGTNVITFVASDTQYMIILRGNEAGASRVDNLSVQEVPVPPTISYSCFTRMRKQ